MDGGSGFARERVDRVRCVEGLTRFAGLQLNAPGCLTGSRRRVQTASQVAHGCSLSTLRAHLHFMALREREKKNLVKWSSCVVTPCVSGYVARIPPPSLPPSYFTSETGSLSSLPPSSISTTCP